MQFRIAITQRVVETKEYKDDRDALSQDWIVYLENIFPDSILIPVPNQITNIENWLSTLNINILVLSNGNDWGDRPERDKLEKKCLAWATTNDVPVFAVCRGFQISNLFFGGSITAELKTISQLSHVASIHAIQLTPSKTKKIPFSDIKVNSYHNQGITHQQIAPDLIPFATSDDGIVEGFYHKKHRLLGIQWHPERRGNTPHFDKFLIDALINKKVFWHD